MLLLVLALFVALSRGQDGVTCPSGLLPSNIIDPSFWQGGRGQTRIVGWKDPNHQRSISNTMVLVNTSHVYSLTWPLSESSSPTLLFTGQLRASVSPEFAPPLEGSSLSLFFLCF
jgi:hypothetical protein